MNPPQALINLKKATQKQNWPKIRRYLVRFLTLRREVEGWKFAKDYTRFMHKEYDEGVDNIHFSEGDEMSIDCIKSHLRNVLRTLKIEKYDSAVMCYVADSYNTMKSGNKKYP